MYVGGDRLSVEENMCLKWFLNSCAHKSLEKKGSKEEGERREGRRIINNNSNNKKT